MRTSKSTTMDQSDSFPHSGRLLKNKIMMFSLSKIRLPIQ